MNHSSRILAMYLPQFHRTPENDKWWGEGFTEWKTVKSAKPLFEGHRQPITPKNGFYYDLSEIETLKWQSKLMSEYGIDGACIYHYWFRDGKKVLEKPAELILKNKEISMNFCFCWANESWVRTWSNLGDANVWAAKYETKGEFVNGGILLEQSYGNQESWNKHFNYLLPFFEDKRYIKKENKPVFVLYRPTLIFCLYEMKKIWNELAVNNGFDGIFWVLANCDDNTRKLSDLELVHEPQNVFHNGNVPTLKDKPIHGAFAYEDVINNSLNYLVKNKNISYGGFVSYDDTPRRGYSGNAVLEVTPSAFKEYLIKLIKKNMSFESPFIFLNAWNEWGEGMHLEPDEEFGYTYLEAVRDAVKEASFDACDNKYNGWIKKSEELNCTVIEKKDKYKNYFEILHYWLLKKEFGRSFSKYLESLGYRNIAIYGLGILGRHLIAELSGSITNIKYVIDSNKDITANANVDVVTMAEMKWNDVDVVIVTVTYLYDEIKKDIINYDSNVVIMSLEQIVKEC